MTAPREHQPAPTPTPWRVAIIYPSTVHDEGTPEVSVEVHLDREPECWSVRKVVDSPDGSRLTTFLAEVRRCGRMTSAEAEANARLIVTAVNAHAPLVEACRAALEFAERVGDGRNEHIPLAATVYARLRAALQKAGAADGA